MNKYHTVDEYILGHEQWQDCLLMLREIMFSAPVEEAVKWGGPVYTFNGKNVVGMVAFKSYLGIWFFQGALLEDEKKVLYNSSEEKTRAQRQWRFNGLAEIEENAEDILAYIQEAIENVRAGREIKPQKNKPLIIPQELQELLDNDSDLKLSFDALKLSFKREFAAYISNAKRAETKQKRLERIVPLIRQGTSIWERYNR